MKKLLMHGLDKGVFNTRAIARLVYGPIHREFYKDLQHHEYIEVLQWELPNISLLPEEDRKNLYCEMMKEPSNQDFFTARALCALAHQSSLEMLSQAPESYKIYKHMNFEMKDDIRQGHNIMALAEVLLWHQWGLPYSIEEVATLKHHVGNNIVYMQELRKWMGSNDGKNLLKVLDFTILHTDLSDDELLHTVPLDILYKFLLKIYGSIQY